MIKLLIYEIAERLGADRFVPPQWGYLGPTEESHHPRPTPWIFQDSPGWRYGDLQRYINRTRHLR